MTTEYACRHREWLAYKICGVDQLSLPKIRSIWIRNVPQNHRIIKFDAYDPALARVGVKPMARMTKKINPGRELGFLISIPLLHVGVGSRDDETIAHHKSVGL